MMRIRRSWLWCACFVGALLGFKSTHAVVGAEPALAPAQSKPSESLDLTRPDAVSNSQSQLMLDLPGSGTDPAKIDFANLPRLAGAHAIVSRGDPEWKFRLHNYLVHYAGKYWCCWSHGPVIEDKATQHIRFATSDDGLTWSESHVLAGPPQAGYGYIARGFWLREGTLWALGALFEAPSFHGLDLELVAFRWNPARATWEPPVHVFGDAINNFPPQRLPTGEWMLERRNANRDVSMLIGGVKDLDDWQVIPVAPYDVAQGIAPAEPDWWVLPQGGIVGLYRDNTSSRRLLRAFSTDNGHTWTKPVRTNFPDAKSKFNALRTSRGYQVLVSNANPAARHPLCLSTSDNGLVFTRMAVLAIPGAESVMYPHVIEQDGHLLIAFSRQKTSIEVFKIPLSEIEKLRGNIP